MDPCVLYDRGDKVTGFVFGGGKEYGIRNFVLVNGFSLGSYHIRVVVRNRIIVDGRLGGRGEIDVIAMLLVVLVPDKSHQIVNHLLHIVHEREEDSCEIFDK